MYRSGTSSFGAVFLVINAALGAGLLNFPKAFNDAGGIEVALTVQAVLLFFVIGSLLVLAKCSDNNGSQTVQVKKQTDMLKIGPNLMNNNKTSLKTSISNVIKFQ